MSQEIENFEELKASLTPNQRVFCDEYLIDRNGSRAYLAAYKSVKKDETARRCASRLLSTNVHIQAYVDAKLEEISEKTGLSVESILNDLEEVKNRCMQAVSALDLDGEPLGEFNFNAQGAIKALELLGKHLQMFTDKHKLEVKGDLTGLTDEELEARLTRLLDRCGYVGEGGG